MRFSGKVVLVTGAGSGIGRAAALRFAAEGGAVAALDLDEQSALQTVERIQRDGGRALAITSDVADWKAVEDGVEQVANTLGPIDVLFNNAGVAQRERVTEQDDDGWERVFRVNVRGVFVCSHHAIPRMTKPGGCIVNTSSVVGLVGVRNRAAYSSSKGALLTLTKNMALDYAPEGIRVNAVCPGFVRTPMTDGLFADPEREQRVTAMHPLGRLATPDDVVAAVLFLASDDASFITGQALAVDGGFSAGRPEDI